MTMVTGSAPTPVERFKHTSQDDVEDDEIDLGALARRVWAYRVEILVVSVVCAAAAAAMALSGGRRYEAQVSVVVSQSKVGERLEGSTPVATFRPLLESKNLAAAVIQELGLNKPPHNVSPTTFFDNVATIEEIRNSPVVAVKVVLDDPALAARTANLIADRAVELSRAMSQREALRARDDLQLQRDEARARMDQARENLRKFQEASQAELVKKDVDSLLDQRGELLGLLIQIESEKARLAKAEQELASRQRISTVKRTIDSDPALMESARKNSDPASNLAGLQTSNEFVDSVYEGLDSEIASSRTMLAALERKKTQIVDVRKLDASQVSQLTNLYRVEGELKHLEVEHDLATAVYRQAATAYETARGQVASRSAQLEILDRAVPPDLPASRHITRNAVAGLCVGFVLALIGAAIHGTVLNRRQNMPGSRGV